MSDAATATLPADLLTTVPPASIRGRLVLRVIASAGATIGVAVGTFLVAGAIAGWPAQTTLLGTPGEPTPTVSPKPTVSPTQPVTVEPDPVEETSRSPVVVEPGQFVAEPFPEEWWLLSPPVGGGAFVGPVEYPRDDFISADEAVEIAINHPESGFSDRPGQWHTVKSVWLVNFKFGPTMAYYTPEPYPAYIVELVGPVHPMNDMGSEFPDGTMPPEVAEAQSTGIIVIDATGENAPVLLGVPCRINPHRGIDCLSSGG